MTADIELLAIYLHLAWAAAKRRRPLVQVRFLVLAAAVSVELELPEVAAFCRQRILQENSAHLLRRWSSVEQALREPDFQALLQLLQRRYPRERAEQLLESIGWERGQERETYGSDAEYAASLLGTSVDELRRAWRRQEES